MAETSFIVDNGRRLNLKDAAARKAIEELNKKIESGGGGGGGGSGEDGGGINRNLLDNWYFANPVDQRGGMVVPPGTNVYNDSALTSLVGASGMYYRVVETGSSYVKVLNEGGGYFYADKSASFRGYTGEGYTIDRWRLGGSNSVVLVENDCIRLKSANSFYQRIENHESFAGKTVTFSLLIECVASGGGQLGFVVDDKWLTPALALPKTVGEKTVASVTVNLPESATKISAWYYGGNGTDYKIYAAKLELGTTQTIAHQENGVWVLNDIPNFQQEMAKCQRYCYVVGADGKNIYFGMGQASNSTDVLAYVNFPVPMRGEQHASLVGMISATRNFGTFCGTTVQPSISAVDTGENQTGVLLFVGGLSGLTAGETYMLFTDSGQNSRLIISADL